MELSPVFVGALVWQLECSFHSQSLKGRGAVSKSRKEIVEEFLATNPCSIDQVEIEDDDVIFFFEDSDEPFSVREFEKDSPTRKWMEELIESIFSSPS
jgi:hypothetical protein